MFHVVLKCGFPESWARAILHRPWHKNVRCTWDGRALRLEADNDYDDNGLALLDEFSDAIVAYVKEAEYSDMRVISVTSF